jgi:hypothetical protein
MYPVGVYFLWRHTRLAHNTKIGILVAFIVTTVLMVVVHAAHEWLYIGQGAAFVLLWLNVKHLDMPITGKRSTSLPGTSGVLLVEEAQSAPERRLLLAREFSRLATEALTIPPADRPTWPTPSTLAALRREAELLLVSASDTAVTFLPETRPDDPLTQERLKAVIGSLVNYLTLLERVQNLPTVEAEQVRVIARERSRVRVGTDGLIGLLQA